LPGISPEKVADVPEPEIVSPPGEAVIVQVPVDGNPFKTTDPVDVAQVGCVIVPMTGAEGPPDTELIVALLEDAAEVHPEAFVTVKV